MWWMTPGSWLYASSIRKLLSWIGAASAASATAGTREASATSGRSGEEPMECLALQTMCRSSSDGRASTPGAASRGTASLTSRRRAPSARASHDREPRPEAIAEEALRDHGVDALVHVHH